MIYFAQPTNGGPIRIGASVNPNVRMQNLGTFLPGGIEFVAVIDGGFMGEAFLHLCFAPIRMDRDWFRSCAEMWQFLISLKDGKPAWMPTEDGAAYRHKLADIADEFGSINHAAKVLGYSSASSCVQALDAQTSKGSRFGARVGFARAMSLGLVPSYIADLHPKPPLIRLVSAA